MYIACWCIEVEVLKVCPFCNAEIPEESVYCLNCASVLNERKVFLAVKDNKNKKAPILFSNKKIMSAVAVLLSFAIIVSSCIFALRSSKDDVPKAEEKNPIIEDNRDNATDNDEQDTVSDSNTETTTEKQGLLDKLFGKDEDETNNSESSETTTKKQSFLDKIFGNDKEDETTNSSTSTTEPETTTKPEETTESTTNKVEDSTTTSTTTSTTESTTESTTIPVSDTEFCTFEYEVYMFNEIKNIQYVRIKKYTGNAKNVIVPSKIDGFYVANIAKYAFSNNDNIETVSFEEDSSQPLLSLSAECFYKCANLHTINIPVKTMGMSVSSIQKCYKMSKITVTNTNYKFEDGKLYCKKSYSNWRLIYWCPATATETYTVPSWCEGIEYACNLNELSNLKTINVHKDCTMFPSGGYIHKNLENIYIDDANSYGYDVNGVAIYTGANSSTTYAVFPGSNKTKDFTIPDNVKLYVSASFYTNPYLETLRISKNAQYTNESELFTNSIFTNLKNVYIQDGHENEEYIRKKFKGNIYTY